MRALSIRRETRLKKYFEFFRRCHELLVFTCFLVFSNELDIFANTQGKISALSSEY